MFKNIRSTYVKGAALLVGSCLLFAGCGSSEKEAANSEFVVVDMEKAQTGELTLKGSFVGTVSPQEQVYVIPLANGTVKETYFEAGDQVNAGDILFRIDDSAVQLQLEQAKLSAESARKQADMALGSQQESTKIQLDSAEAQAVSGYEQAQVQYYALLNSYNTVDSAIDSLEKNIKTLKEQIAAAEGAGSTVSGGEVITTVYLQSQLAKAEESKASLESQSKQLDTQIKAAQAAYRAAEKGLSITDRTKELTEGQVLNDTKSQLNTSLQLAELGVESAELALSYYTVKAPISGVVQSKSVEANGFATSSNPAYVIANENTMTVTFQVSEAVRNTMTVGQEITVERGGVTFGGNVTEIGGAVNQQTGLFQVKAAVNAKGENLPSGVSVKLETDTYSVRNAVLIPYDAVYYDNGGSYVYLCVDDHAVKTYVETGIFDDTTIEITSGITENDTVITSWSPRLLDGALVTAAGSAE